MQASARKPAKTLLPEPIPFSTREPFVGNISVDENLLECVQVALWSATQGKSHGISVSVENGDVVLSGTVVNEAERTACEQAVKAIDGVNSVTNELNVRDLWAGEMLFATRFCQTHTASVVAGIRDALATLIARGARLDGLEPNEVVVVYRNRRPGTITVEVGVPVAAMSGGSGPNGFRQDRLPGGSELSARTTSAGIKGILRTYERLRQQAREQGAQPADWFWHAVSGEELVEAGIEVHLPLVAEARRPV